jgi:hypothetical protein
MTMKVEATLEVARAHRSSKPIRFKKAVRRSAHLAPRVEAGYADTLARNEQQQPCTFVDFAGRAA